MANPAPSALVKYEPLCTQCNSEHTYFNGTETLLTVWMLLFKAIISRKRQVCLFWQQSTGTHELCTLINFHQMEGEDYWNKSENKAFSFDEDDRVSDFKCPFMLSNKSEAYNLSQTISNIPSERKIFVDDNTSELNYDFPTNDIPLHLIISDGDLNKGMDVNGLTVVNSEKIKVFVL